MKVNAEFIPLDSSKASRSKWESPQGKSCPVRIEEYIYHTVVRQLYLNVQAHIDLRRIFSYFFFFSVKSNNAEAFDTMRWGKSFYWRRQIGLHVKLSVSDGCEQNTGLMLSLIMHERKKEGLMMWWVKMDKCGKIFFCYVVICYYHQVAIHRGFKGIRGE